MEAKKILFILNPISGSGSNMDQLRLLISEELNSTEIIYKIEATEYAGHASQIAKEYLSSDFEVFVAVGGDGTVNEVGTAIAGSEKILAIVPKGSGNGLANHLEVPKNILKFISAVKQEEFHVVQMDIVGVNDKVSLNVSGIGFDGYVASQFNQSTRRGLKTYVQLSLRSLFRYKSANYKIEWKEGRLEGKYMIVSIANGSEYGNHFVINPKADMADGLVEICLIKPPKIRQIPLLIFALLFTKRKIGDKFVKHISCSECSISTNHPVSIHIDGESTGDPTDNFKIVTKKKNLNFLSLEN